MCPSCGVSLDESRYLDGMDSVRYKSCPECSRYYGLHAYSPLEAFGDRTMGDGSVIIQSWCHRCRSGEAIGNPARFCPEASST